MLWKKWKTLVPTNESKKEIKKYEELWIKIRDLIRSIIKNSDYYDEKYMKVKFNSGNELPLNKTIEILSMIIVVNAIFYENSKYHPSIIDIILNIIICIIDGKETKL